MEKVIKWFNKRIDDADKEKKKIGINLFIHEGVVRNTVFKQYTYFKYYPDKMLLHLENYAFVDNVAVDLGYSLNDLVRFKFFRHFFNVDVKFGGSVFDFDKVKVGIGEDFKADKKRFDDWGKLLIKGFISLFAYIFHVVENKERVEVIKEKENSNNLIEVESSKRSKKGKNIVKNLSNNVVKYVFKDDFLENENVNKLKYERHTESWTVRGYVRRLKNGKEIYIKPYVKGKGKKKGKQYKL